MSSDAFTGTFQDSSPTTIVTGIECVPESTAGDDDVIDWSTDCIGDGDDVMAITSCVTGYDYDDINADVQAMLESIDFLDAFTSDFDSRHVNRGKNTEVQQYDTDIDNNIVFDTDYHISIGQPTCEKRDKMSVETLSLERNHTNAHVFQHTSTLQKRGIASGKGPSHRTTKKKSKGLPKRPLSKYNLFFQSERLKILAEAMQNHTRISFENLAKIIGKRWHDLSEEDSEKFRILSELDIARYRQEMKAYHAKHRTSTFHTASTTCMDDNDDKTVVSTTGSVKKRSSIGSPKSPLTPRRKRKYSESSVTTASTNCIDNVQKSPPTVTCTLTSSPTLHEQNGTPSDKNDGDIIIFTSEEHETSLSNEEEASDAPEKKKAGQQRDDEVYRTNEDIESNLFNKTSQKVLLHDSAMEPDVLPPQYRQPDDVAKDEQHSGARETNERESPHTPSHHQLRPFYQDFHYNDRNMNIAVLPQPRGLQSRINPIAHTQTNVGQANYPYPRHPAPPSEPHPYFYGNALPPTPFHFAPHHHSYSRPYSYKYHTVALPLDHNKEVLVYDPEIKRDRRYTIQYKCYAMKRSEAHAYLARVSSATAAATAALPSTSSNHIHINNFNSAGKYKISMHQMLHQQHPIPGVEVDLSNHSVPVPIYPLPAERLYSAPPPFPPPPDHYKHPRPPPNSTQYPNQHR